MCKASCSQRVSICGTSPPTHHALRELASRKPANIQGLLTQHFARWYASLPPRTTMKPPWALSSQVFFLCLLAFLSSYSITNFTCQKSVCAPMTCWLIFLPESKNDSKLSKQYALKKNDTAINYANLTGTWRLNQERNWSYSKGSSTGNMQFERILWNIREPLKGILAKDESHKNRTNWIWRASTCLMRFLPV